MLSDVVGQPEAVAYLDRFVTGQVKSCLLFVGDEGVGKKYAALQAIEEIISNDRGLDSSEVFQARKGIHPDVEVLSAPTGKDLGVEPIREMLERAQTYPSAAPHRFVVIDGVDRLTSAAANALLKNLEEPPAATRFLLLAESYDQVLVTIRSRSGRVPFRRLPESFILSKVSLVEKDEQKASLYTRLGEGSVGRALRYWATNKVVLRDHMVSVLNFMSSSDIPSALSVVDEVGDELSLSLKFLRFLLHDLLALHVATDRVINIDIVEDLARLSSRFSLERLGKLSQELKEVEGRNASSYINLPFHTKTALIMAFSS